MGSWAKTTVELIGDTEQEIKYKEIIKNGTNISLEVSAMIFDQEKDDFISVISTAKNNSALFMYLSAVANLPDCPNFILYQMKSNFGENWQKQYYAKLNR